MWCVWCVLASLLMVTWYTKTTHALLCYECAANSTHHDCAGKWARPPQKFAAYRYKYNCKGEFSLCFMRVFRRRATNHWLVQRGCYAFPNEPALGWRDKAYDLLPFGRRRRRVRRSHNEVDNRLICTNERTAYGVLHVCTCGYDMCNAAPRPKTHVVSSINMIFVFSRIAHVFTA